MRYSPDAGPADTSWMYPFWGEDPGDVALFGNPSSSVTPPCAHGHTKPRPPDPREFLLLLNRYILHAAKERDKNPARWLIISNKSQTFSCACAVNTE